MSGRTWSRAAALAVAMALPVLPVVSAAAAPNTSGAVAHVAKHGPDGAADDNGGNDHKKQKGKKAKREFNLGGRLTAVDATAHTVTFRVHGGKVKALRGTELTVVVADGARVRRDDAAATLADLAVGDKVRAKGKQVDGVYTASRVQAESPQVDDAPGGTDD
jgi:hypothetical protein